MKRNRQILACVALMAALFFGGLGIGPALAAPPAQQGAAIQLTGRVLLVQTGARTLQIAAVTLTGPRGYTVHVPEAFDLSSVQVGDTVRVVGTLVSGRVIRASSIWVFVPPTPTPTPTPEATLTGTLTSTATGVPEDAKLGFFCRNLSASHPVGRAIAATYGVPYEQVMRWFCERRLGFGQIMLALHTARVTGEGADTHIQSRVQGRGWGQIWRDLGLTSRGVKRLPAEPSDDAEELEDQEADQAGARSTPTKGRKLDRDVDEAQDRDEDKDKDQSAQVEEQEKEKGPRVRERARPRKTPLPLTPARPRDRATGNPQGGRR